MTDSDTLLAGSKDVREFFGTDNDKARVINSRTQEEFERWLTSRYSFDEVIGKSAALLALETWAYRDEVEADAVVMCVAPLTQEIASQQSKIDELQRRLDAVMPYAWHKTFCLAMNAENQNCDCGFDEAIKRGDV